MKRLFDFFARLFGKVEEQATILVYELPEHIRAWQKAIDERDILRAIHAAEQYAKMSDAERRARAREILKRTVSDKLSISLPDSVANLLIELIFQKLKIPVWP